MLKQFFQRLVSGIGFGLGMGISFKILKTDYKEKVSNKKRDN